MVPHSTTLNSIYNKVTFNKKSAIMKENLCTKYFPFTYKYVTFNEKPPIMKENLHTFFHYRQSQVCINVLNAIQFNTRKPRGNLNTMNEEAA